MSIREMFKQSQNQASNQPLTVQSIVGQQSLSQNNNPKNQSNISKKNQDRNLTASDLLKSHNTKMTTILSSSTVGTYKTVQQEQQQMQDPLASLRKNDVKFQDKMIQNRERTQRRPEQMRNQLNGMIDEYIREDDYHDGDLSDYDEENDQGPIRKGQKTKHDQFTEGMTNLSQKSKSKKENMDLENNFLKSIEVSLKKRKCAPLNENPTTSQAKNKLIKLLHNDKIQDRFLTMLEVENCSDDDIKAFLNPIFQIIVIVSEKNYFKMMDILIKKLEKIVDNPSISLDEESGKLSIPMLLWGSVNKIFSDKMVMLKDNKFKEYFHSAIKAIIEYPQRHFIIHKLLKLFHAEVNIFKAVVASICMIKQNEEAEAEMILRELKDLAISEGNRDETEIKLLLQEIKESLESEYKIDLSFILHL